MYKLKRMKTKVRKDWYGREKNIEELHNDSKIWISEIHFISDEIRFLEHLLSSKYIDCLYSGLYNKIRASSKKIVKEKEMGRDILKIILEQEVTLSSLIKKDSVISNKNFLETHKRLEIEVQNYFKKYKRLKKQIFDVVEKVMKVKEQKKLA